MTDNFQNTPDHTGYNSRICSTAMKMLSTFPAAVRLDALVTISRYELLGSAINA